MKLRSKYSIIVINFQNERPFCGRVGTSLRKILLILKDPPPFLGENSREKGKDA